MKQLIELIASSQEEQLLSDFFAQADQHLPLATFVVFNPEKQVSTSDMVSILSSNTTMPVCDAEIDLAMRAQNVFVLSANNNMVLGNGFFVSHNTMAQQATPFAEAFWLSLAKCVTFQIALVVLTPDLSITEQVLRLKPNNQWLLCTALNPNAVLPTPKHQQYDLVLPAIDLPIAISQQLMAQMPQSPLSEPLQDSPVATTTAVLGEHASESDFDDLLQHLRTAVLYLNHRLAIRQFSNFLQHYLPLDNSALGKTIEQINTQLLPPDFVQWVKQVAETKIPLQKDLPLNNGEWCDLKIVPLYYSNSLFKGIMVSITDTTSIMRVHHVLDCLSKELHSQGAEFWKERQKANDAAQNKTQLLAAFDQQHGLWNNIAQTMNEGIIALHSDNTISYINPAAQNMTHLQLNDPIKNWLQTHRFYLLQDRQIPIPIEQNPLIRALQGHYSDKEYIDLCVAPNESNAEDTFISIHTQALLDKNQNNEGILIVLRDITDRKKFEIGLQESELQQKALLFALPDSMFHINRQGEYLSYIPAKNDQQHDDVFLKYESAFFIGNRIQDTLGDMGSDIMEMFEIAIQTKEVQTRHANWHHAERIYHYDMRLSLVNHNEALVLMRDITEEIAGKHVVHKYSEYYQSLLEYYPLPIVWIDQSGNIRHANSKIKNLGIEPNQIINQKFYDYLAPKYLLRAQTALENAFKGNVNDMGKYLIRIRQGKLLAVKVKSSIIVFNKERLLQVIIGTKRNSENN